MNLNEETYRIRQMMGLDEQRGQILKFVKSLVDKSKSTKPATQMLSNVTRKFKNVDDAILFYEKRRKSFEAEWMSLMKKLRNKEVNAQQYSNGLEILKKQYGIKDVNHFNNKISELKDRKKVSNLKSIVGNLSQEKILTNPEQLGKNISAGGSNNLGVFDLGNGYVAKKSKFGFKDDGIELLKYKDKIKSPRISKTVQVKNMPEADGTQSLYIVQQKAVGKPMSDMSVEEIRKIPQTQIKNFEKDLNELKNLGVTVDPSKMNNFIYNPDKGIQLIDLNVGNYLSQPGRIEHTINHVLRRK